jgi:hypothetical protein
LDARFQALAAPLLWVHHEEDPCRFTSYQDARGYAQKTGRPLLTVRGGGPEKGDSTLLADALQGPNGPRRALE